MSRVTQLPLIVAFAAGVLYCAALALAPQTLLLAFASDDAFYYFKIARNIVQGAGCSFDGIAPTNGFHPLWMVLLLPIYMLVPDHLVLAAGLSMALNGLIGIATLYFLYRFVEEHLAPGWGWLTIAVCCLPNILSGLTNGMETALQLAAVTLLLHASARGRLLAFRATPIEGVLLGLLLGLVALSRLDSAFLIIAVGLMNLVGIVLGKQTFVQAAVRVLAISVGVLTALFPFFAWNLMSFGHVMPISGSVKSALPSLKDSLAIEGDMVLGLGLLIVIAALFALGSVRRGGSHLPRPNRLDSPLLMLALGSLLHYLHAFLFLTWGVYWWHFTLYGLTIALLLPVVLRGVFEFPSTRFRWLLAAPLLLIGLGLQTRAAMIKYNQHLSWMEGVNWARDNTEPGTVFALKDAGLFGYFSDRPVINLDGKANGYVYRDHLLGCSLDAYLREQQVAYVAHIHSRYADDQVWIPLARPNQELCWLFMPRSEQVFRSEDAGDSARFGTPKSARFAIWNYRPPEQARVDR